MAELFAGLSEEHRRLVVSRMPRRGFRKGDTLFHEGDLGDSLHILEKGTVAVRTSTPLGDVVTLAVMGAGASFGEQALLSDDSRRTASVVAMEPVETRMLHRHDFEQLRTDHPSIERFLVELLSAQVPRGSRIALSTPATATGTWKPKLASVRYSALARLPSSAALSSARVALIGIRLPVPYWPPVQPVLTSQHFTPPLAMRSLSRLP